MATAYPVPAYLRFKRSSQSGIYPMTVAWQTVYANSQTYAWIFAASRIDLTNMLLGDDIEIRLSSRNAAGGAYIVQDQLLFEDVQPVETKKITIGPVMDTYGVLVEMRQPAGALITCYCEFFDAVR